ncbi:MAG: TonB C-terminal domain-containing protein [candidate division WOR-3 bacterium]|nr:TonB C-terminal domain-containing protein [candidate division WOR-3 bacterium]MCX7757473.1 TonB C-terminal domain-containing protein [candidate division WOR-3 bacterium]MDW7987148.1 energy transducer TonB [candidate division WOR-3 bacterium]
MVKELLISFLGHMFIVGSIILYSVFYVNKKIRPEFHEIYWVQLEPSTVEKNVAEALSVVETPTQTIVTTTVTKKNEASRVIKTLNKFANTSNVGGVKLLNKPGKESYYLELVLRKIANNWNVPIKNIGVPLRTIIFFVIKKDGTISSIRVEESSGNSIFDYSASRAVSNTKILPPLGGEFAHLESLIIHLEFEQKLQ